MSDSQSSAPTSNSVTMLLTAVSRMNQAKMQDQLGQELPETHNQLQKIAEMMESAVIISLGSHNKAEAWLNSQKNNPTMNLQDPDLVSAMTDLKVISEEHAKNANLMAQMAQKFKAQIVSQKQHHDQVLNQALSPVDPILAAAFSEIQKSLQTAGPEELQYASTQLSRILGLQFQEAARTDPGSVQLKTRNELITDLGNDLRAQQELKQEVRVEITRESILQTAAAMPTAATFEQVRQTTTTTETLTKETVLLNKEVPFATPDPIESPYKEEKDVSATSSAQKDTPEADALAPIMSSLSAGLKMLSGQAEGLINAARTKVERSDSFDHFKNKIATEAAKHVTKEALSQGIDHASKIAHTAVEQVSATAKKEAAVFVNDMGSKLISGLGSLAQGIAKRRAEQEQKKDASQSNDSDHKGPNL